MGDSNDLGIPVEFKLDLLLKKKKFDIDLRYCRLDHP